MLRRLIGIRSTIMPGIKYLSQNEAQEIDKRLMSEQGAFSIDQLMELAGLACAQAVQKLFPDTKKFPKVLVACGPGNQGGDGLVAARHLHHFGYKPTIFYPKQGSNPLYQRLVIQAQNLQIPFVTTESTPFEEIVKSHSVVLDAIFGFSFKGEPREPFKAVIDTLKTYEKQVPIVSVDIPSAWDVEEGNINDRSFNPYALVSLTAPKKGALKFKNIHLLGGRFVPDQLEKEFGLNLPLYPGSDQIVEITNIKAE